MFKIKNERKLNYHLSKVSFYYINFIPKGNDEKKKKLLIFLIFFAIKVLFLFNKFSNIYKIII